MRTARAARWLLAGLWLASGCTDATGMVLPAGAPNHFGPLTLSDGCEYSMCHALLRGEL